MKICSPQMGISPNSNLGGAVHDREILKYLAKLGVEVLIPLPKGEAVEDILGWHVYRTPRHIKYYYEYNWLFLPSMIKAWKSHRFDVLRIHSPTLSPLGWLYKSITGIPTHGNFHHFEPKYIQNLFNRITIKRYDLITTVSKYSANKLSKLFKYPRDKIVVIYNGIDEKYKPLEKKYKRLGALDL